MPDNNYAEKLNEYLTTYIDVRKMVEEKRKELTGLQQRREALLDLLVYLKNQKAPASEDLQEPSLFPLVLGKTHSKFSVISIGALPPEESKSFVNSSFIYPPGYKIKRKYISMNKSEPKTTYHCQIRNVNGECVFEIRSSDGGAWSGEKDKMWKDFCGEFERISFPNVESFFGLTHEAVQRLIEDAGDISVLPEYIPIAARAKKGRKTKRGQ